jgi:YfiH family protein
VGDDPDSVRVYRTHLERQMGLAPASLRFMSQTHSDRVVSTSGSSRAPDADALVSPDGSEPLAVLVADCVPIVLADTGRVGGTPGPTAVVHAGRAGVGNGIVGKAVAALRHEGAREVTAWIGPSVCGECYEVPETMMRALAAECPEAESRTRAGTFALDLPAAVRAQLTRLSVAVEPVRAVGGSCTLENLSLYSHRREPGAGRIAGLVWRS